MTESANTGPNQRRFVICCASLLVAAGVATGGYFAVKGFPCAGCSQGGEETQDAAPPSFMQAPVKYTQWQPPLVALVLTGQMHGYVDPCGCSKPQFGGLIRRYEFIQSLKEKKWDIVGIDLGELPATKGIHTQNLLKFDLTVNALAKMNYHAFGIGKYEVELGLGEGLAQIYDDKRPLPRPLNLSLAQVGPGQLFQQLNVSGYEIINLGKAKPKIGVISMMGPDLREALKGRVQFADSNMDALKKALKALGDAGVEIGIILHHEYPKIDENNLKNRLAAQVIVEERKKKAQECAEFCAAERKKNPKIPVIQLMMVLCEEAGAPAFLGELPNLPTRIVEMGHKGHDVGLVGVYRQGKEFKLEHQNVEMSEEWLPRRGKEGDNPVVVLMERYHEQLKKVNMLAQFPRTLHFNQVGPKGLRATYVGSDRCGDCHAQAYDVWKKTDHAKATDTLEDKHKERPPLGRQYDPECMKCHTTGFKHPGGYNDLVVNLADWPAPPAQKPAAKKVQDHNTNLRGVSCESCHGPGSEHVKNPNNKDVYALINPFGPSIQERKLEAIANKAPAEAKAHEQLVRLRMQNMRSLCASCHDDENDVNFGNPGKDVADKWAKIIHRTQANNVPAAKGNNPPGVIELIDGKK